MDAGIEKECSALGGLFQLIMTDMKAGYPTWEDFVNKGVKLQTQLRNTVVVIGTFLDAFQKIADMATGTRGATKEIGSALTRMCLRHRSIESKLKLFTTSLSESLVSPLELKIEEWKKGAGQLDKDHAKEYKKARSDIKKKSSDTIKLQKKVKKGRGEARCQLDSALQDVNVRYAALEEAERRAVCRALIEERGRYCSFVSMMRPVLDHEINLLGEVTHLQSLLEDLTNLTLEPNKLPAASEQVILDLKGSDFNFSYQTPPASPNSLSRKSSISSYQSGSVRHVPSLDSISCSDGVHLQDAFGSSNQLVPGGGVVTENGLLAPPLNAFALPGERPRAMSASGKCCTSRDQLTSDQSRSSRDSLHESSGYSTQTTTPSCSEDPIHTHIDYESVSLHGDVDSASFRHLGSSHLSGSSQSDLDRSLTVPRNSDLRLQFRDFVQSKRPSSSVSVLVDIQPQTATIRRKPSTKPSYRRGTISGAVGGVPLAIRTPQVPLRALSGTASEENFFRPPSGGVARPGHMTLSSSTHSLNTAVASSYHQPTPIPVPVPTVPQKNPGGYGNTGEYGQIRKPGKSGQYETPGHTVNTGGHENTEKFRNTIRPSNTAQYGVNGQYDNSGLNINTVGHEKTGEYGTIGPTGEYGTIRPYGNNAQPGKTGQYETSGLPGNTGEYETIGEPGNTGPTNPPGATGLYGTNFQQQNQQPINSQQQNQQPINSQQQRQKLYQQQHQAAAHSSEVHSGGPSHSSHDAGAGGGASEGGGDMLTLIRRVTLKRTFTNDRSAPFLPPPPPPTNQ